MILRMPTNDIRAIGRATQGVTADRHRGRRQGRVDRAAGRKGRRRRDAPAPADAPSRRRTDAAARRRSSSLLLTLIAVAARGRRRAARCSTQFFAASRLRDRTALQQFSTVVFEPRIRRHRSPASTIVGVDAEDATAAGVEDVTIDAPVRLPDGADRAEDVRDHDARQPRQDRRDDHGDQRTRGSSFDSAAVITHSPSRRQLTLASRESTVEWPLSRRGSRARPQGRRAPRCRTR